jgi:hypothetical protein
MQQWVSLICMLLLACVNAHGEIGEKKACSMDMDGDLCEVDAYIGSQVIYEDEKVSYSHTIMLPYPPSPSPTHPHTHTPPPTPFN